MKKILFILLCLLAGAQTMKAQEAYVVMNNNTWKFYYDTKRESREGHAYLLHGENENPVWNLSVVEQAKITKEFLILAKMLWKYGVEVIIPYLNNY